MCMQAQKLRVPIKVIQVISQTQGSTRAYACPGAEQYVDSEGTWAQLNKAAAHGALLVRPDGHLGWRSSDAGSAATAPTDRWYQDQLLLAASQIAQPT